ncbi:hypothetical protein U9M48_037037 [Paspalum notatum var. saurae]|uniref:Uncharacterized protein n=1 Tax=Paspalum notatum var. saurae TaxID=547442 RepID=A0AAQ3UF57_PASNO
MYDTNGPRAIKLVDNVRSKVAGPMSCWQEAYQGAPRWPQRIRDDFFFETNKICHHLRLMDQQHKARQTKTTAK